MPQLSLSAAGFFTRNVRIKCLVHAFDERQKMGASPLLFKRGKISKSIVRNAWH
jgi:hypothetical protein